MNDLLIQFSSDEGEGSYGRTVAALIRAEQHNLAEDKLIADLTSLPVPLAELCLDTRDDPIELQPWDALQQLIFRPSGRTGSLCSAVKMNLSIHGEPQPTPDEWTEPFMEVGLCDDDDGFPFSARSREEILAASADYRSPWHGGVRDFLEMQVVGLARLHTAIQLDESPSAVYQHGRSPSLLTSADYAARKLAEWLRALRYHQTVKRYLDHEGFARSLPVIVGCHDLPPFFEAVYYPSPSRESAAEAQARMEAVRAVELRAFRAEKAREIWEYADSMREMRKAIRRGPRAWKAPEYLHKYRAHYEGKEAFVAGINKLGPPKRPSWQIADDDEFERFLKRFYVDPFLE